MFVYWTRLLVWVEVLVVVEQRWLWDWVRHQSVPEVRTQQWLGTIGTCVVVNVAVAVDVDIVVDGCCGE